MSSETAPTAPPILPSTGGCSPQLPNSEDDKPQPSSLGGAGPVSTPTVASNTDAVTEEVELPKPQQPSVVTVPPASTDNKPSPNAAKKTQSDLKGSIAVSVVASSHASLNEALKRLRTEFENIKSSGVACEKALSTIDSLLIESESVLRELISRSQGGDSEGAKKRRANAKRSGRRAGQKKEEGNKAPGPAAEEGITGVPKEQNSSASPRRSGGIVRNKRVMPLGGIFANDRPALRGPAASFQSPAARPPVPFRIDETVMQYRSPEFYRLIGDRFVAPGPRKPRPPFGREREVVKKSRLAARAREEAALRDELRKATTAAEYTALMEKANKMGMQFEVAAVNARLEKLARQAEQPAAS
eukprot:Protomagalhaensia_sp_Gyna_25__1654@NODE_185_length_4558_cov_389_890020_g144_i0_p2_GENE_NODE_185_length_4558_cov_389_890020_g144_i0NODE_185_length_4558_cov_389_890020_g144_i0_p2_ORF_typecomplete_len358_score70_07Lectin_N/PF03954_14/0_003Lectin_N/PF03954_14/1_3e03_NODE_185_length_4558_cov_389_890020_g144_i01921265